MESFGFESSGLPRSTSMYPIPVADPGRFHLILTVDGEPRMHSWWDDKVTSRRKFRSWVDEYGSLVGAHIVLVDKEEGAALAVWPDDGASIVSGGS
ncbi:hypothetical protein AB0D11_44050 [Streptomyces monashensis]|uniref:hypothetical protein n=1 Tax=Streptomyces monashensis TaxID=1678012 RepID=UPI0033E91658